MKTRNYKHKGLIIGSFRKHYKEISDVIDIFDKADIEILSPKKATALNPEDEFVVFDYDPKHLSEKELEDLVLEKIHRVDFVYLVNPGGYVGLSAAFEVGYCIAHKINVFAMEPSSELCAKYLYGVMRPEEIVKYIKR
ncbi:MAG: hypothetical protein AAB583_00045 [Patescibacteria group bacterium]